MDQQNSIRVSTALGLVIGENTVTPSVKLIARVFTEVAKKIVLTPIIPQTSNK